MRVKRRGIKESAPSKPWNKETTTLGKMAFATVFNLLDHYINWDEDEMMPEKTEAERNKFYQVMQGIYHAVEQFTPEVEDFMNSKVIFERKF